MAVALLVLGLHLVLILIFSASFIVTRPQTPEQTLVWINLPPLLREPAAAPKATARTAPPRRSRAAPQPSGNAITEPAPAPSSPDPAATALRDYVGCGLTDDRRSAEARERCTALRNSLHPGPFEERKPTPEEEARDRRFAQEHARDKAPPQLPCFHGAVIDINHCLVPSILDGFDFHLGNYADNDPQGKRGDVPTPPKAP